MSDTLPPIDALLRRLQRRERALFLLRAGLLGAAAFSLGWVALVVAINLGVPLRGAGWLGGLGGLAALAALAGAWRWRELGSLRRQALRVERAVPELRGALLAVWDRQPPSGAGADSPALLERLAAHAWQIARPLSPARAVPLAMVRAAALTAALGVGVVAMTVALPTGPIQALAGLIAPEIVEQVAEDAPPPQAVKVVVGDITLRYLYPTYTGLEPLVVENSNGEIHAPPGTQVEIRARTAEPVESAALQRGDAPPQPLPLEEGRRFSATIEVKEPGVYRFVFGALSSADYPIVVEPDLAPDVAVQARETKMEVTQDRPLALPWVAKDDYGLREVVLEIEQRGKRRQVQVRRPQDTPRLLNGELLQTPKELGLQPGDVVNLRVGAWDNDAVSGTKVGWSATIRVEVMGPQGQLARMQRYRLALRDALVKVLADYVVEPAPVAQTPVEIRPWVDRANRRYEEVDAIAREAFGGEKLATFDATVMEAITDARRALLAFARNASQSPGPTLAEKDVGELGSLQAAHIDAVEKGILVLDQVIRAAAVAEASSLTQSLAEMADQLQKDFDSLSKQELLARLDQLERQMAALAEASSRLDDGELKEFLNQRGDEVKNLLDEIRKAIAEGRMEDAKALMEKLAEQSRQMAQDMKDMQSRQSQEAQQLAENMEKLGSELEKLQQEQQALREETERLRKEGGPQAEQLMKLWEQVEKLSGEIVESEDQVERSLGDFRELAPDLLDRHASVQEDAGGLHDSAQARDASAALRRVSGLQDSLRWFARRLEILTKSLKDPTLAREAPVLRAQAQADLQRALQIEQLLEQLNQQQQQASPEVTQQLQQLAQRQQQLNQQLEQAGQKAQQLQQQLPMNAPGLEEGMEQAQAQGERSKNAMEQGKPMEAEGGQRGAEQGLQQARDALQEAQRNLEQMQQQASGQGNSGEQQAGEKDGGKDGDGQEQGRMDDFQLPAPEAFQTPEEYRKALLEGMEGAVPEEYRSLNRRYYEELVRQ